MKNEILKFVKSNTSSRTLETVSTKEVAVNFGIATSEAYSILKSLSSKRLIVHYDPINGQNLECADWCITEADENLEREQLKSKLATIDKQLGMKNPIVSSRKIEMYKTIRPQIEKRLRFIG